MSAPHKHAETGSFHAMTSVRFTVTASGLGQQGAERGHPVTEGQGPNAASVTAIHVPMARTRSCGQCCKGGREMLSSFMATCSGGGGQFERTTSGFTAPTLSLERESGFWTNWFLSFVSQNPENGRESLKGKGKERKQGGKQLLRVLDTSHSWSCF